VGSINGSAANWTALFKEYSPNTSQATITASWTVSGGCSNGGPFFNDLVDEWSGVDQSNFVDASNSGNGSGSCSLNVTPAAANDGIDGFCNDTVTGVGNGYTAGANDGSGDWSEYRVLSASSGVAQTVSFTGGGTWEEFAVAVKPSGSSTLTLTLPSGFTIPAAMDCGDVDAATSSQFNFNWPACQATATAWGFSATGLVATLTAPTDGAVHVAAGTPITIKIGANATFQQQGVHWITNPSSGGVYTIAVGGTFGGSGQVDAGVLRYADLVGHATLPPEDTG
jgi:hypothetical protein